MKIQQKKFSKSKGWEVLRDDNFNSELCNFVLAFGSREIISEPEIFSYIKSSYPNATILLNSTSGEIIDTQVTDDTVSLTSILFEKTKIKIASTQIDKVKDSYDAGKQLAEQVDPSGLKYVMVISDGQKVNGSELVLGLQEHLPSGTIITGGLAGDGGRFQKTVVGLNESPVEGRIVAIGFYGNSLSVTYGILMEVLEAGILSAPSDWLPNQKQMYYTNWMENQRLIFIKCTWENTLTNFLNQDCCFP